MMGYWNSPNLGQQDHGMACRRAVLGARLTCRDGLGMVPITTRTVRNARCIRVVEWTRPS